jgi:hypothetical protein
MIYLYNMNLQEQISRMKSIMGIIKENELKPCKKCMKSYSNGRMDDCAYQAIERFEENYGTAQGTSMGINYFESTYSKFNSIIMARIDNVIGSSAWDSMPEKFKMQLWSFMFNSDSGGTDKYRWLAVLYLTANEEITEFSKSITSKIINKTNLEEWKKAKELVSNTTSWDLDKFVKMLDGQYSTYGNTGAYKNSWSIRPDYLNQMYDECKGGDTEELNPDEMLKNVAKQFSTGNDTEELNPDEIDKDGLPDPKEEE